MVQQDKTYSIRWYGPFETKEDVGNYEKKHPNISFQLYMFHGLKKRAKIYESYYCGQAKNGVFRRLSDKNHHINEISRMTAIWIGTISNVLSPTNNDINYVENIITAQLAKKFTKKQLLNVINKNFPDYNIYVINIWHKVDDSRYRKYIKYTLPADLPDLLGHEYETEPFPLHKIYSAEKVKWTDVDW